MDFTGNEIFLLIVTLRSERRRAKESIGFAKGDKKQELAFRIIDLDNLIRKFDCLMTKKDQQDGRPS